MEIFTIESPANIAFIKYWGQKDRRLVLPNNDSFSMNLSGCKVVLKFEKKSNTNKKQLWIKNYENQDFQAASVTEILNIEKYYQTAKQYLGVKEDFGFSLYSEINFPKKSGIASSAAFFSALALAFSRAWGKKLSKKKLSILARLSGSGSACRSIDDGFNWWRKGSNSNNSYAQSIAPPDFWDIADLVVILTTKEKQIGSQEGHLTAASSSFYDFRLKDVKRRARLIKRAFFEKNFTVFGELIEEEVISMYSVMMTQKPPLYYWSGKTLDLIKELIYLRKKGKEVYYTLDAGENLHLICRQKEITQIKQYLSGYPDIQKIIINYPDKGTHLQ
jgi:diphosphomevalonate decarboxylase